MIREAQKRIDRAEQEYSQGLITRQQARSQVAVELEVIHSALPFAGEIVRVSLPQTYFRD